MKPQLLLLHGALGAASQFIQIKERLAVNFEISLLDFSGHGQKEISEGELSLSLFCTDVLSYLEKSNIPEVYIFGYSMGGFVALNFALLHPNKVKGIITLATKFDWTKESAEREAGFLIPEKIKLKVPAFAKHLQQLHGNKWESLVQQTSNLLKSLGVNNPLTTFQLQQIKCKVLIALGDADKMVSLSETETAQRSISNSTLLLLPSTPHPWEQVNPQLIAAALEDFLSSEKKLENP
ncbi:MAG: alpha/beta hydrolase [Bacteroidetes bacterium]|nr:alpha/beta hydrolase [Bacteroidota bacterium]